MCFNAENNCNIIGTKNITISLKELLKNYFNLKAELKDEIHDLMSKKPYLWKTRPLNEKLIYYAGCDVKYLPKIYDIICKKCEKKIYSDITIENIFNECNKYLKYLDINKDIKNFTRTDLKKDKKISGLIKNFQHKCVFIQLNIGYMGIVTNYKNVSTLKEKYQLGDIVDFTIGEIENDKKRLVLNLYEKKIDEKINIRESIKAILARKEKEEKQRKEISSKLIHDNINININKKGFYPKSYLNKYHNFITSQSQTNSINENNMMNYYGYYQDNNMANIGNKTFSGHFYYNNNFNNGNLVNNGLIYNGEDNAYYFEQSDENSPSNYYYVINRFQDSYPNRYGRQPK